MPEVQVDVAVANRFISSLSKSLQALCHGCMDFDSGIEIVGYINVNIDCGSKVDYVLNEKVLKSTTNSMTFVSNSFLAKKEQAKNTQDGSCSPIQELTSQSQFTSPYQHRMRGSFHGTHPRSTMPMSQSFTFRGGQKRSWTGMERDWRMSPKKHRGGRHQYLSSSETSSTPQSALYPPSSQNIDSNFKLPKTSTQTSHTDTSGADSQSGVNIKKEIMDSDSASYESEQTSSAADKSEQERTTNINIKSDPDAVTPGSGDGETFASDGAANNEEIKDQFLEPSNPEETQQPDEKFTEESSSQQDTDGKQENPEDNLSFHEHSASDSQNVTDDQDSNNLADSAYDETGADNVTTGLDIAVEYDEAGEESVYPQSVYSDAGEGSSDAGQFEVIEIDDEDEDVQAMFAESRVNGSGCRRKHRQVFKTSRERRSIRSALESQNAHLSHDADHFLREGATSDQDQCSQTRQITVDICSICRIALPIGISYQQHFSEVHSVKRDSLHAEPFICEICLKGFITRERLRQHSTVHDTALFSCFICDVKFKHKKNIKRHMESTHGLKKCTYCLGLFVKGLEFDNHVLNCESKELYYSGQGLD